VPAEAPPAPDPSPPLASLAGGGEKTHAAACANPRLSDSIASSAVCTSPKLE